MGAGFRRMAFSHHWRRSPFFAFGALFSSGAPVEVYEYLTRFGVSLLNAVVTAATGAVLFAFVAALGYDRRAAWLATAAFGVASLAWPYARTSSPNR